MPPRRERRPSDKVKPGRIKGVSIFRPFGSFSYNFPSVLWQHSYLLLVYGSIAKPFDANNRPAGIDADHTHQWSVYVRGINGEDISYWLKKVQFKLHETYTNSLRTIESPPFEVTETGWGEFEVVIKLYFVPEAAEKPQNLWHALKLHPYGPDAEAQRERKDAITSQSYEEIIFNEPAEPFYEIMTSGAPPPLSAHGGPGSSGRGKGGKSAKQQLQAAAAAKRGGGERSAEIPFADSPENPYSQKAEGAELDRLQVAIKTVEAMVQEEKAKLIEKEKILAGLKNSGEGVLAVVDTGRGKAKR